MCLHTSSNHGFNPKSYWFHEGFSSAPLGRCCCAKSRWWFVFSLYGLVIVLLHLHARPRLCFLSWCDKSPMPMTDSPLLNAMSRRRPPPHRRGRKVGAHFETTGVSGSAFLSLLFHLPLPLKKKKKNLHSCFSLTFALSVVCCHLLVALV